MRNVFVSWGLLAGVVASAHAQQTPDCGAPVQNYLPELPAPGSPYVSVATDLKGIAPVKPAVVVNVLLPGSSKPFVAQGSFHVGVGGSFLPLAVAKIESLVMAPGPRAASPVADGGMLAAQHQTFQTHYRLYLQVPAEAAEQFIVTFPQWVSLDRVLSIPPLSMRRIAGDPGVEICSVLPGPAR